MILTSLAITPEEFAERTGWVIKAEGACKAERCVPLPTMPASRLDVRVLAERLGMPLIHDDKQGLWCLGPEAGADGLSREPAMPVTSTLTKHRKGGVLRLARGAAHVGQHHPRAR